MAKHVTLRLDPELHSWLVAAAAREHRSINGHIEWCLEQQRRRESLHGKEIRHLDGDPRNNDPGNLEIRERRSGD
jgi:hypothetical protein